MKLTVDNLHTILKDCFFPEGTDIPIDVPGKVVIVEGIIQKFGFDPAKIAKHREEIRELLNELPDNFHVDKGGGWTFLNLCIDKHGNHWGEHQQAEALVALGLATGMLTYCLPRDQWFVFPGNMPYVQIDTVTTALSPVEVQAGG